VINRQTLYAAVALVFASQTPGFLLAQDRSSESNSTAVVRIGAVAYAPSTVTVFQGLCRYLNRNRLPSDYVLYSNYDALVAALDRGDIDVAWNTPLAHAQFHRKQHGSSQTLVMRDVDCDVRSALVVRTDSGIRSLADLVGKRLVLGSMESAEAVVLPLYYLAKENVDVRKLEIVSLDKEFDSKGNPCSSPRHVLQALRDRRGDAGVITERLWGEFFQARPSEELPLTLIWTSPAFSHCVFSASTKFDKRLADRFTQLMTAMDPHDPLTADVMRLEGTKKWLPGSPRGFADLVEAIR
jgi:ABC-type phosphate/phosphonate transport system substrate-binding protein